MKFIGLTNSKTKELLNVNFELVKYYAGKENCTIRFIDGTSIVVMETAETIDKLLFLKN